MSKVFVYTLYLIGFFLLGCNGQSNVVVTTPAVISNPTTLNYVSPGTHFTKGVAVTALTPTVTGSPTSITISPALPAGLSLNSITGVISGTPTVALAPTTFTATAHAIDGSLVTSTFSFEVAFPFTITTTADAGDLNPGDQLCATAATQCSLRAALEEANALTGVLSILTVPAGTYIPLTTLNINSRLEFYGASAATTIISGNNTLNQIISIGNNTVLMQDFAVKNGRDTTGVTINGVGISSVSSNLILKNCEFSNHVVTSNLATIVINGLALSSKSLSVTSQVSIDNCVFDSNSLTLGGSTSSGNLLGAGADLIANSVTVNNSTFNANTASGGASNFFAAYGGGLYLNASLLSLSNNTFTNNNLTTNGYNDKGGAIYYTGAATAASIDRTTCDLNTATKGGGCLFLAAGPVTISNSSITNNSDNSGEGGGITDATNALVTITNSYFDTGVFGTALLHTQALSNPNLLVTNSTFRSDGSYGVNMYSTRPGSSSFQNCTFISENSGVSFYKASSATALINIKNSVFENLTGGTSCFGDMARITSLGYNIARDSTCSFMSGGLGDLVSTNPQVGAPALNGGTTKTAALAAGSAARDIIPLGSCPLTTDQRGTARPRGGFCDAGAYEY